MAFRREQSGRTPRQGGRTLIHQARQGGTCAKVSHACVHHGGCKACKGYQRREDQRHDA